MSDLINPNVYGVLPSGFSRMRLPEIRQSIINSLNSTIGVTFETRPDSISGQFIDTFAEREATLWELAESVYHAMYPISASGVNLDHAVSFAGVRRLFAERSYVWVILYGQEQTIIPAGSVVRSGETQDQFTTRAEVIITRNVCSDITVAINTAVVGEQYWIRLNTILYSYTCVAFDQPVNIASNLFAQMVNSGFEQELNANEIRVYAIESVPFAAQFSTNIALVKVGSPGFVDALDEGPILTPTGSVNTIVSMITGWDDVNNIVPGHIGRNLETDDELRLRYNRGVYRLGAGTLPAIKANLEQNITGLISVEVFENVNDVPDSEGRLPHSIEVVAYGGDAQEIGEQIFALKAAGIDTNGEVEVNVTDAAGYVHLIKFNRPTPIYFWVDVEVALYNEEIFPDNGAQQIQVIIAQTGNNFGIGKDVIIQRFMGPVYSGVTGIASLDIKVAYSEDGNEAPDSGAYTNANVPIASRQVAEFDASRVQVTVLGNLRR